jgi:hypothetical protein
MFPTRKLDYELEALDTFTESKYLITVNNIVLNFFPLFFL